MKNIFLYFSLYVLSQISTACFAQETEVRNLPSFSSVHSSSSFKVFLKKGEKEAVKIVAEGIELGKIETEVKEGRLHLGLKNSVWNWKNFKVTMYITYLQLEGISVSGSSEVNVESVLNAEKLSFNISGSGEIMAKVDANDIKAGISGSGDLALAGTAGNIDVNISGSGKINAFSLTSKGVRANISGSGNAEVNASESITATVSGSGDVRYKGNPSKINSRSTGSGKIKKVNNSN